MTRYPPRLPLTRCSIAARSSSFCQGLKPPAPTKTAQAALWISAASSASCQGSPGTRFQLSRKGSIPACLSRRASSSTLGLSALLWERKTSYWLRDGAAMRGTSSGFAQLANATFRPASYPTNGQQAFCQRRLDKEKVLYAY